MKSHKKSSSKALLILITTLLLASAVKSNFLRLDDNCQFNISTLIERANQNSGRYINKLGYYSSCNEQKDKIYYLAETYGFLYTINYVFIGFCTPANCSPQDIESVVETLWGKLPYKGISVTNVKEFEEEKFKSDFGSYVFYFWFTITFGYAIYATIVNRRKVWAEKRERRRLKRLGLYETAGERRKSRRLTATVGDVKKKSQPDMTVIWDLVSNLNSLLHATRVNSSVQVFELLRILAFFWVIFSHEFAYRLKLSQNYIDVSFLDYTKNSWAFTVVESGYYAVDIFLFMGGYVSILATSKYVNQFQGLEGKHWIPVYLYAIVKRYIRIMPAYAIMMLFFWKVSYNFTSGPLTPDWFFCSPSNFWESWILGWKSSIDEGGMCAGWCWYLAVDFQLYLTVPLIVLIVNGKKKAGIALSSSLALLCTALTIIVCYWKNLHWLNYDDGKMNQYYYAKSYLRGNLYYLGCLVAYITSKDKGAKKKHKKAPKREYTEEEKEAHKKKKKSRGKLILLIVFLVGSALMIADTLILHYMFQWGRNSKQYSHHLHVLFITFGKVIFVSSFMAILMPISFTYKGFSKFIAENRLIQLLGNISFTGYLFHFVVILIRMHGTESLPSYSFYDLLGAWCTDLFYTTFLATMGSLLVEIPVQAMWRTRFESKIINSMKHWVQKTKSHHHHPHKRKNSKNEEIHEEEEVANLQEKEIKEKDVNLQAERVEENEEDFANVDLKEEDGEDLTLGEAKVVQGQ